MIKLDNSRIFAEDAGRILLHKIEQQSLPIYYVE